MATVYISVLENSVCTDLPEYDENPVDIFTAPNIFSYALGSDGVLCENKTNPAPYLSVMLRKLSADIQISSPTSVGTNVLRDIIEGLL
jgi:hypothetical protein